MLRSIPFAVVTIGLLAARLEAQERAWSISGTIFEPTARNQLVRLASGEVLLSGGFACGGTCATASTEIYNPVTERWTRARPMNAPRIDHTAVLLNNGRVLMSGGTASDSLAGLASSELYDATAGTWLLSGDLSVPRWAHESVLLPGGSVLAVGGLNNLLGTGQVALNSTETYSPAEGRWTASGAMSVPRIRPRAVVLPDGRVLVCGGSINGARPQATPRCEIYSPSNRSWVPAASMKDGRIGHTLTLLSNGKVLAAGGSPDNLTPIRSSELYDPVADAWKPLPDMSIVRLYATATVLPDGQVLMVGGAVSPSEATNTAEYFDTEREKWLPAPSLAQPSALHSAALLPNGRVLVAGGIASSGSPLSSGQLFGSLPPAPGRAVAVSGASFTDNSTLSPASYVAAFGLGLATITAIDPSLPTSLGNITVGVADTSGAQRSARILSVSPGQVNFLMPDGLQNGPVTISFSRAGVGVPVAVAQAQVAGVSPALFTAPATGQGPAAAVVLKYPAVGEPSFHLAAATSSSGQVSPVPIQLGAPGDKVFLSLFGTGIRGAGSISAIRATVGAIPCEVTFAGPSPEFPGLDQVNVLLDRSLIGAGQVDVVLTVLGRPTNPVRVQIQ